MSGNIHFCLSVITSSACDDNPAFLDVSVQVWRGKEYVETIKLLDYETTDVPAETDAEVLENYATSVARVIARRLADVQLAAVDAEDLHTRKQYEVPADA